jgi:hypothetical protein
MELPPPINGTEAYLAAILAELRAIRGLMESPERPSAEIELREPEPVSKSVKRKT